MAVYTKFEKKNIEEILSYYSIGKLKFFKPISCTSSSNFNDDFSCNNLYDGSPSTWQDAQQSCENAFLEFEFSINGLSFGIFPSSCIR